MSDSDGDNTTLDTPFTPSLEDMQHWAGVIGRSQQMMLEFALGQANDGKKQAEAANLFDPARWFDNPLAKMMTDQAGQAASQTMAFWSSLAGLTQPLAPEPAKDRRFAAPEWSDNPVFAMIRQSYGLLSEQMLSATRNMEGLDPAARAKMEFAAKGLADALSPTNIAITNPEVMKRAIATRGESLLKGLRHMLADLSRGQLSHVDPDAFQVGVNIATTPGKVIHETPLYQLIHYTPTTAKVLEVPLLIFPPWINRFYILDLNPAKSFVAWALEQGLSVFMVSWKSADASMKDVVWDDYIAAQIDAIDTVRKVLKVPAVHSIGYCVAGTTLAATLAVLAARGKADKVKSATFFTAQVDFELAGDLKLFIDDGHLALLEQISAPGYLDGRYMAMTFNMLRGRDLIWNYVVNNYLMGNDYPPFDLLYWNGDTTNLPAKWHRQYLTELYRDNRLVVSGSLTVDGTPVDLRKIETPAFIQAGREDHIAPVESVWRLMHHLSGPKTFLLAGSGHIAGVVNPPAANKYQYWTNDDPGATLDEFVAGATETKGSWWPYWRQWIEGEDAAMVATKGARIPGEGAKKALDDAPGSYVRSR